MDMRDHIVEGTRRCREVKVTREFLDRAFPHPPRPKAEDVWLNIQERVGALCIVDRGQTNIFQPTQAEQIDEFCKRNGLQMSDSHGPDYGQVKCFQRIR